MSQATLQSPLPFRLSAGGTTGLGIQHPIYVNANGRFFTDERSEPRGITLK